jgi:MHS family proline/betaine transporter-like MFS transporter
MIGNTLEWYDFALYGFFAPIFGQLFFPHSDPVMSLIVSFGVFAVGFLMRPIGAVFFGYIGDSYGRKKALVLSMYLMAFPTLSIAFLPTYAQCGIIAPILLTLVRAIQGFSMGGEFTGSIVFIGEHAPLEKRGFYGSLAIFSLVLGTFLGSLVAGLITFLLPEDALMSWGWRVPFLISIIGGFVGMYMRHYVSESGEFHATKKARVPFLKLCNDYKFEMILVILIDMTVAVGFYLISIYIASYLSSFANISRVDSFMINIIGLFFLGLVIPFCGMLSDKVGPKRIMMSAAICFLLFTVILFQNFFAPSIITVLFSYICLALIMGVYYAPLGGLLVSIFPVAVRYSGVSIAHNLSMTIFGGTAPMVVTFFIRSTNNLMAPALYLMCAVAASIVGLLLLKNKTKEEVVEAF